jgi:hypothetical protein
LLSSTDFEAVSFVLTFTDVAFLSGSVLVWPLTADVWKKEIEQ